MTVTAKIISNWDNALSAARFKVGKSTPSCNYIDSKGCKLERRDYLKLFDKE